MKIGTLIALTRVLLSANIITSKYLLVKISKAEKGETKGYRQIVGPDKGETKGYRQILGQAFTVAGNL